MSDFLSLLMIGGALGWILSTLSPTNATHSILLNIVAGSVGSYLGSVLIGPVLRGGVTGHWLAGVVGAFTMLTTIVLAHRTRLF